MQPLPGGGATHGSMMSAADEIRLVRAYRDSRSETAFRALFRAFSGQPYRVALRMLGQKQDADDALHDVWIRALEGIATFREESSFSTWLVGICINRCREILRMRGTPLDVSATPAVVSPPQGERLDLERAIALLPAGYRAVLMLHDVEGHTHEEIGRFLDIEPGTSKSQLWHARRAVRTLLNGKERGDGGH